MTPKGVMLFKYKKHEGGSPRVAICLQNPICCFARAPAFKSAGVRQLRPAIFAKRNEDINVVLMLRADEWMMASVVSFDISGVKLFATRKKFDY